MSPHYISLFISYTAVVCLWFLTDRFSPTIWNEEKISFRRPSLEFLVAIVAVIVILGIGQLYTRDLLIPNDGNRLVDALNQCIIFSPAFILLLIRRHSLRTVWLSGSHIGLRIGIGLLLALFAIALYWLTRKDAHGFAEILRNTYHTQNISHFVQVFMEDVTIALLFVRLSAWIGRKWSIILVAVLFAAGHIPSLLAGGATIMELGSLFSDVFLGVIILTAVSRSRDILWFFMVHYAMDMTQFYGA